MLEVRSCVPPLRPPATDDCLARPDPRVSARDIDEGRATRDKPSFGIGQSCGVEQDEQCRSVFSYQLKLDVLDMTVRDNFRKLFLNKRIPAGVKNSVNRFGR